MNKLNTDLHRKTTGIEDRNGLEMYRQICNIVDALPANYKFYLDAQLAALPHKHADNIKGLKELYEFRVLLKKQVAEYKKVIGNDPSQEKLKEILWVVMDKGNKQQGRTGSRS